MKCSGGKRKDTAGAIPEIETITGAAAPQIFLAMYKHQVNSSEILQSYNAMIQAIAKQVAASMVSVDASYGVNTNWQAPEYFQAKRADKLFRRMIAATGAVHPRTAVLMGYHFEAAIKREVTSLAKARLAEMRQKLAEWWQKLHAERLPTYTTTQQ